MDVTFVVLPTVEAVTVVAFLALAVVAVVRAPGSGSSGRWVAAAFVAVALGLAGLWGPDVIGLHGPEWLGEASAVLLLAFPYLLLRFTATFRDLPRGIQAGALVSGLAATALVLFGGTAGALLAVLVYWVGVSAVTVVRLWRAGRDQPTVARRRMRMMAVATAVLAAALVVAAALNDVTHWMDLVAATLVLGSTVAFGLGLTPPRALRLSWRRPEDEVLQAATVAVMGATSVDEVADELLSPTTRIVGGAGASLVDEAGLVVASWGQAPDPGSPLPAGGSDGIGSRQVVPLGDGRGQLVVWTSPYTPFFGPEEVGLLRTMGAVAGLALDRSGRLQAERERRVELERARRESERAREEADRANAAKSEFLSRMSHELRTPLNAILGFGQLLETSDLTPDDEEGVDHILKAGRHLLALINDVLDLSKIEAGKLTISPEPVHAGELIADALALIRPQATERAIRLVNSEELCDTWVMTDRQRCRQVLLNLLSNAVKYNHDGGTVEVGCSHVHETTVRITVRDTGVGIDPDRHDRLFEPFERLGAESSAVEGTGLGLALTKQLIERLGGAIGLRSARGQGSTFWIDLPATEQPATHEGSERQPVSGDTPGERTLLLIEDNLANLRVVEAMMRRRPDVAVLPAMQGGLGLDLAYQHRPDVVVLDLHLPDLSGREVLTRLKADPRTRDIPVIIASADATPRRGQQLVDEGAFDYLTKPLDLQRFLDVVDAALTARPTTRQAHR